MYLHTRTHNFPYILVQAMSCSIDTALWHNDSFTKKKKDCQMYIHTHTTLISLIFLFKQKFRKFPYKKL